MLAVADNAVTGGKDEIVTLSGAAFANAAIHAVTNWSQTFGLATGGHQLFVNYATALATNANVGAITPVAAEAALRDLFVLNYPGVFFGVSDAPFPLEWTIPTPIGTE